MKSFIIYINKIESVLIILNIKNNILFENMKGLRMQYFHWLSQKYIH